MMFVWYSCPEEELYRDLTSKLQQYQGKTADMPNSVEHRW